MSEVLDLTKELITFPSISPHDEGCQAVLKERLKKLQFSIVDIPFQEASNFWAKRGNKGRTVVFAGHTDVVPPGSLALWGQDPFTPTIIDDNLYGRGAADMKGGLAAMIIACENFYRLYPHFDEGTIAFLITSAEEGPSELGTPQVIEYLKETKQTLDYCIIGEPTAANLVGDTIKNGRRGSLSGELIIQGKQGHIAYPHLAENPIHSSASALSEFIKIKWDSGNEYFCATSLQISNIHGGVGATNVIPDHLSVLFNFRYSSEIYAKELKKLTYDFFNQFSFKYHIKWTHFGMPFLTREGPLITAASLAVEDVCGFQPQLSTSGGTSDGRYIAAICPEVIEIGVSNKTIHHSNEHVRIADLDILAKIYEKMLITLLVLPSNPNKLEN